MEEGCYTDREINTLSMQMMRMEKDGLVRKTRETPKSTLLSFEMTEKGQQICKDIYEIVSDKVIISFLSEAERQQMISMLSRIIDATEKYTPGATLTADMAVRGCALALIYQQIALRYLLFDLWYPITLVSPATGRAVSLEQKLNYR